jgi:hypothetical protein
MTIRWINKMDGNVGEMTEGDEGKKGVRDEDTKEIIFPERLNLHVF